MSVQATLVIREFNISVPRMPKLGVHSISLDFKVKTTRRGEGQLYPQEKDKKASKRKVKM
jgi:hypothetical protein